MKPSGIEWIGDIPDDWEVRRLKGLGEQTIGLTYSPQDITDNSGTLVLRSSNIQNGKLVLDRDDNVYVSIDVENKILKDEDILICSRNGSRNLVGKTAFVITYGKKLSYGAFTTIFRSKYNKFLFYVFNAGVFEYHLASYNTSTINQLTTSMLNEIRVPFPPVKTQQKIADYLDEKCGEIDATIAKQKESIEKLKAYKQSLISETVTKGLDKSAPLKPSGIEWIGDIPDDWEVRKLLSIFKEHKDRNKNLEEQNLLSLSYGKIKRKDINNNDGLLPASFETYNIVENGDIVFRLTDLQNDKRSLRTGIVTQRGIITSAYVTIRPKIRLDSRFFHYLYHMYDICKVFYGMGDGVRQGMGFEDLKNIPTLIPPLKTQQKIADYLDSKCSQIDKYITEKQNIIQKLDAYKKSLIFECVTGKKRI